MADRRDEDELATRDALRALARSAKSEAALRAQLERRHPIGAVARALASLRAGGWIDDARAARELAGRLVERDLLALAGVRARLRERGFDETTVAAALEALEVDEARGLTALAARTPFDRRHPQRLAARLTRAGYDAEAVAELVARLLEQTADG
ncbi:MAG: RecX family transcriptional regulator [Deltaproteobacteria bacterium]|nr:RecX family transcriptional regulator [Deltaproteobacteria bacterium]